MDLDCSFGGAEFRRNLLVPQPFDHQVQHLAFARCQRLEAALELGLFRPGRLETLVLPDGFRDDAQQGFDLERCGQEIHGATFHRFYAHGNMAMSGEENNGGADEAASWPAVVFAWLREREMRRVKTAP